MNTTNRTNFAALAKFWALAGAGRSAALDIGPDGQLAARHTISNDPARIEGAGAPPAPYTDAWQRVIVSTRGVINAPTAELSGGCKPSA